MRISPLSPEWRIVTLAPSARPSFSSSARVSASTGLAALRGRAVGEAGAFAQALDVAHGEALGDDAVGERVGVGDGEQRARMAGGDRARGEQGAAVLGQLGQAQRVGDVAAALADDAGDVGVGVAVIGGELRVAVGLFERVEIGALDVLDDGDFERLAVAGLDDEDRDFVQAGALGGAPAPFAGDDLVGVGDARDRRAPAPAG